jgi:hypothetical protein
MSNSSIGQCSNWEKLSRGAQSVLKTTFQLPSVQILNTDLRKACNELFTLPKVICKYATQPLCRTLPSNIFKYLNN